MTDGHGIIIASDELRAEVDGSLSVCAPLDPKDFPDWQRLLTAENDPRNFLRNEWQKENDCNANSATSGNEVVEKRRKGKAGEQSRMFVYQGTEIIDGKLGQNTGTSVPAAVKLLKDQGAPLELEYPYSQYTRNRQQFDRWNTAAIKASAATRRISGAIVAPSFAEAKIHLALGNPIHWGHFWGLSFRTEEIVPGLTARVCRQYRRSHGSSGHATEVVWPVLTARGEWLFWVANSHNDKGFFISEPAYEEMRDRNYSPYGAYVLLGDESPHCQYEGQFNPMGID